MRGLEPRLSKYLTLNYKTRADLKSISLSLPTLTLKAGSSSWISKVSFILHCPSPKYQNDPISGLDMVSNGWSSVIFSEGLKMFGFSIMKPSFSFINVKTITIPAICSVNDSGLLWTINTVLVRNERFYASIALKNDLQVNTSVEFLHTRFQAFSDLVAL